MYKNQGCFWITDLLQQIVVQGRGMQVNITLVAQLLGHSVMASFRLLGRSVMASIQ